MREVIKKVKVIMIVAVIALFFNGCSKKSDGFFTNNPAATPTPGKSIYAPIANFTFSIANPQVLFSGVTFTSTSINNSLTPMYYQWYFGDGSTSTQQTPTNYYTSASYTGLPYNVKLVVTTGFGTDTITKPVSFASPLITNIGNYALPGSVITITGVNFGVGIAANSVSLNGIPATLNSATTTAITFTVPPNAASGPLLLTTNGTTLNTNFMVYNLVAGTPFNANLKHINYTFDGSSNGVFGAANTEYVADNESDSVYYDLFSVTGAAMQYAGFMGGEYQAVPAAVKLWGIANQYATSTSDYRIYKYGSPTNYTIFAGSGVSGYTDGQGASAQFVAPMGMVADAAGNLYVNDAHRVRKISKTGLVTTLAGNGTDGHTDGQGTGATFGNLYGIAVDLAGNVYVSDNEYRNIRKVTPTGVVTTLAGGGTAGFIDGAGSTAQFYYPKGIAVDATGDVFVSDSNYNNATGPYTSVIRMVNSLGVVTTLFNSNKGSPISNPDGITFLGNGFLVCNTGPGAANQNVLPLIFAAK